MQCVWIAIVLFVCIGYTQALKCYVCSLDTCSDPFDKSQKESLLQECPSLASDACVKAKSSNGVVVRSCGNQLACSVIGGDNTCRSESGETACCCTGDGCNSASTRRIGYISLVAMLVFGKAVVALF